MNRGGGVAGAATLVGVLSAVSLLLGFGRVVIAAVFGASAELDAYLVAQGLMNVVLGLVAGALAKAVVPVVAPAVAAGDPDGAHRSVAAALTVAVVVPRAAAATHTTAGPASRSGGWDAAVRLAGVGVAVTYVLALALLRAPEVAMLNDGLRGVAGWLRQRARGRRR